MSKIIKINHICYDETHIPKIYVNKNTIFQQIYRSGSDINWNNIDYCFEPINNQSSDIISFFSRTLISVMSELGISLVLDSKTKISNISINELEQLINTFYYCLLEKNKEYPIVYVHENGNVTEVQLSDRLYLQTKYKGSDGDRPFIKENYTSKTYDGRNAGYCFRKSIPNQIVVNLPENKNMYMNLKQMLQRIKNMNYEIDYKEIDYLKLLISFQEKNA